jgi:hypothetical protein
MIARFVYACVALKHCTECTEYRHYAVVVDAPRLGQWPACPVTELGSKHRVSVQSLCAIAFSALAQWRQIQCGRLQLSSDRTLGYIPADISHAKGFVRWGPASLHTRKRVGLGHGQS